MSCRSGCRTKNHKSYAECLKAANAKTMMGAVVRRSTESELEAYRRARAAGIQPAGTTHAAIDAANATSDRYGAAFDATDGTVGGKPAGIVELGG